MQFPRQFLFFKIEHALRNRYFDLEVGKKNDDWTQGPSVWLEEKYL